MEKFTEILGVIDDAVWGVPLIILDHGGRHFADAETERDFRFAIWEKRFASW